jgi:hypothetical protein
MPVPVPPLANLDEHWQARSLEACGTVQAGVKSDAWQAALVHGTLGAIWWGGQGMGGTMGDDEALACNCQRS